MSACQLLANSSSSTILSCKTCPDCNVLFNHSFFCVVECMIPTTTVLPTTTVSPTTTISPTTTVPPPTTTIFLTTTTRYNSTTTVVKNVTTNVTSTTTTTFLPTTTVILKNESNRMINHSNNPFYHATNYSEVQEQFSQDDFVVFLVLCLPMALIIVVILYHCFCKKTLKKHRVVIPQDVTIDIVDENNEKTVEEENVDENSKVINHVVKAVVNDLIKNVENIHNIKRKLPSALTANKALQRLQAVNRRISRKRRERQLNSLVLRNMNTEKKPLTHGMRIKEIFEQSKETQDIKDDSDLI